MSDNKRKVLVLGGTGAMGTDLTKILADKRFSVTVTSRGDHRSNRDNVTYVKGNAKDNDFLREVIKTRWDCVIDFMSYSTAEFEGRVDSLLSATDQYIFISSARVYAESLKPLTEDSPRLLDVCDDKEYLATDEYALAKARQENMLAQRAMLGNYTIVRPSLTYNSDRLQFAISEKEEWLYRALHGRSIIFPSDMVDVRTTMAYGYDVANAIFGLVFNQKALGQTVHITGAESKTWQEILVIYQKTLEKRMNCKIKVLNVDDSDKIAAMLDRTYQIKYSRRVNRSFDCKKLVEISGALVFTPVDEGLRVCVNAFLDGAQNFAVISGRTHAYFDLLAGESTALNEFMSKKEKLKYMIARHTPYFRFS